MRIAVCSQDREERHLISRLIDETLLLQGKIPKILLFPIVHELLEAAVQETERFDAVLLSGHRDEDTLRRLCNITPVVLIGEQALMPTAFDVGAAYFIELPVNEQKLTRALACIARQQRKQDLYFPKAGQVKPKTNQ